MARILIWLSLLLVGCTAGRASVAVVQARQAVDRAARAGAEEHARYELTMARAYLTKAREEASFSSYREAVELARGAADWADRAIIEMERAGTGEATSAARATAPPGGRPDEAPAEGTGMSEDAPAQDAPSAEDAPAEDTPAEDAPAEDTPAEDAPAEDAPAEDAPAEAAPAEDTPAEDAPPKKVIIVPAEPEDGEGESP